MKPSTSIAEVRNAYQRESAYSAYTRSAYGVATGGGPAAPQNVQATSQDRNIHLTWDADANLGYAVKISLEDNFASAQDIDLNILSGSTSYDVDTTDNTPANSPLPLATGTRAYFWVCGTDGAGNPITDPSTSAAGRAFVTLADTAVATLYVPDGATINLGDLFFGNTPVPVNMFILAPDLYFTNAEDNWVDGFSDPANAIPISGSFELTNSSGGTFTFWDSEP